jgi:hypothetical protein
MYIGEVLSGYRRPVLAGFAFIDGFTDQLRGRGRGHEFLGPISSVFYIINIWGIISTKFTIHIILWLHTGWERVI